MEKDGPFGKFTQGLLHVECPPTLDGDVRDQVRDRSHTFRPVLATNLHVSVISASHPLLVVPKRSGQLPASPLFVWFWTPGAM